MKNTQRQAIRRLEPFWSVALMAIFAAFTTEAEADSVVTPNWVNQTVLQGCGSSQSNSNSTSSNRAGFQKVVTNELKNATSVQITWGVQARDLGLGMNVNDWNPYIEVRSLQATSSSVVASINLNIDNFINLDGTPIQITTTNADSSNFISPVNYGTSLTGRTNYVFAYILTGDGLNHGRPVITQTISIGWDRSHHKFWGLIPQVVHLE